MKHLHYDNLVIAISDHLAQTVEQAATEFMQEGRYTVWPIAGYCDERDEVFLPGFDTAEDGEVVDLVIGPARDGQMLELFLHRRQPKIVYLFHVLHLRQKTIDRAQDIIDQRKGGNR